ncbi:MAG: hypothetical protein HZC38_05045 [Chloroflexi bacterium]|nr:hypothetical protein [Chloroflexota bacterium]
MIKKIQRQLRYIYFSLRIAFRLTWIAIQIVWSQLHPKGFRNPSVSKSDV